MYVRLIKKKQYLIQTSVTNPENSDLLEEGIRVHVDKLVQLVQLDDRVWSEEEVLGGHGDLHVLVGDVVGADTLEQVDGAVELPVGVQHLQQLGVVQDVGDVEDGLARIGTQDQGNLQW